MENNEHGARQENPTPPEDIMQQPLDLPDQAPTPQETSVDHRHRSGIPHISSTSILRVARQHKGILGKLHLNR
jgi:hypothetical protein